MYLHLFFLLFTSGVSSSFLPLKETPHPQNRTKYTIIDEMLCLLEAEDKSIKEYFYQPLHLKNRNCAHHNTEIFLCGLRRIATFKCMKIVERDLQKLKYSCPVLKESSANEEKCYEIKATDFSQFKKSLEEFLKWVNGKQDCPNITRIESGLYPAGNCRCHDL